ncbi:MAG: hypothetical protein MZV63_58010 [Marinilabiliales bacterium]|nr:hypothetical protein [Marinilabiliales bacterium]
MVSDITGLDVCSSAGGRIANQTRGMEQRAQRLSGRAAQWPMASSKRRATSFLFMCWTRRITAIMQPTSTGWVTGEPRPP